VTLIDTNILLDLTSPDAEWGRWSERVLDSSSLRGALVINDVVFAELSVGYDRIEDCEEFLDTIRVRREPMPAAALFLAGKAFRAYRLRGGPRTGVLPDFFIGAHATVTGLPLITRDPRRYRSYFPALRLIAPDAGR
jgi:predicted nucleic acid-binding protein